MPASNEIPPEIRAKRLFFTVTTGRSGTRYLARVLGLFRGTKSLHEPKPTFSSAFRTVRTAPATAREFWLEHKLPAIARHRAGVYVETTHLACKGFLESLASIGVPFELLHLHREPRAVAKSLLALDTIPGRTYKGVKYYLSPADETFLPISELATRPLTDYQVCYWYCLEIAERARVLAERFAQHGVKMHRVELGEILDADGIARLGERLGLPGFSLRGRIARGWVGRRALNSRPEKKRPVTFSDAELAELEAELHARLAPHMTAAPSDAQLLTRG